MKYRRKFVACLCIDGFPVLVPGIYALHGDHNIAVTLYPSLGLRFEEKVKEFTPSVKEVSDHIEGAQPYLDRFLIETVRLHDPTKIVIDEKVTITYYVGTLLTVKV